MVLDDGDGYFGATTFLLSVVTVSCHIKAPIHCFYVRITNGLGEMLQQLESATEDFKERIPGILISN